MSASIITIPARSGKAAYAEAGQRIKVINTHGQQVVDTWAFRKDSPQLAAVVNDFLKKNREGTLVGNVLKNRYIRDFDWAANALDDIDYQRFLELQHIFQKMSTKRVPTPLYFLLHIHFLQRSTSHYWKLTSICEREFLFPLHRARATFLQKRIPHPTLSHFHG